MQLLTDFISYFHSVLCILNYFLLWLGFDSFSDLLPITLSLVFKPKIHFHFHKGEVKRKRVNKIKRKRRKNRKGRKGR